MFLHIIRAEGKLQYLGNVDKKRENRNIPTHHLIWFNKLAHQNVTSPLWCPEDGQLLQCIFLRIHHLKNI